MSRKDLCLAAVRVFREFAGAHQQISGTNREILKRLTPAALAVTAGVGSMRTVGRGILGKLGTEWKGGSPLLQPRHISLEIVRPPILGLRSEHLHVRCAIKVHL
jgi:hypothetical protein